MNIYNECCNSCSKIITEKYSTSFSLGIKSFAPEYREPIYNIYGFVRFADEIVDTFHDYDKKYLLEKFKKDTYKSISDGISLNPVLHSFQYSVNKYGIQLEHIEAFLKSMEMDLYDIKYDDKKLKEYIYGSAEVVGLMCLRVFCKGDNNMYNELESYAISLGSAFQKINFLRDIKDDYIDKGRVYFPDVDFHNFNQLDKIRIEKDIQVDFDNALIGIKNLPKGVRLGVFLAYKYYVSLFDKIKKASPDKILQKRFRINDGKKMLLFTSSAIKNSLNLV